MKRLAMNLEKSPVAGLKSYLQIIRDSRTRIPGHLTPRWWLAPDYQPMERDEFGLAWRIRGPGLKALIKPERLTAAGKVEDDLHQAAFDRRAANFNHLQPSAVRPVQIDQCLCPTAGVLGSGHDGRPDSNFRAE